MKRERTPRTGSVAGCVKARPATITREDHRGNSGAEALMCGLFLTEVNLGEKQMERENETNSSPPPKTEPRNEGQDLTFFIAQFIHLQDGVLQERFH